MLVDAARRCGKHVIERLLELGNAPAADCDGLDHGNTKLPFKRLWVEHESIALGKVHHVQGKDGRKTKLDQLEREAKMVVEVRSIDDDDECVRMAFALLIAKKHVAGYGLIGTCRFKAVGSGKVDHLDPTAICKS